MTPKIWGLDKPICIVLFLCILIIVHHPVGKRMSANPQHALNIQIRYRTKLPLKIFSMSKWKLRLTENVRSQSKFC